MIRRLLSPAKLSAAVPCLLLILAISFITGCPQPRIAGNGNGGNAAKAKDEPVVPDSEEALAVINEVGARTVKDDNGNITSADFSDLAVRDDQVPLLAGLPKLKKLRLWGSLITDGVFDELVKLESVVDVGLANTEITDAGLQNLEKMPQLRTVFLRRNTYLSDDAFDVFPKLPKLSLLNLVPTMP